MNDKIKELEQQCWGHRIDGALVDGHLHFDTQKFAELIIKECAAEADKQTIYCRGIPWGRWLKEHFGVKE